MSKSGGVFQIDDVTRTMSKGGVRLVFHPSKFRPPPPGWLATGLYIYTALGGVRQMPHLVAKPRTTDQP